MDEKKIKDILGLYLDNPDGKGKITISHYLKLLLLEVWNRKESFSGKIPFGDSGWEYDLYIPLIENGFIKGKIDEDGYIDHCNHDQGDLVICECINYIFED